MIKKCSLDEYIQWNDMKDRRLYLLMNIDQFSVSDIVTSILNYNREDIGIPVEKRQPIRLYIATYGGEVDSGFELIDIIRASTTPVYTINMGYLYSMGALIGIAGHKRFSTQNAKYLIHDGTNFVYNSGQKAQDQMRFNAKVEERVRGYILSSTTISSEEYDEKVRFEWYMFADEAKEKGLCDSIIGVDCSIDEVL